MNIIAQVKALKFPPGQYIVVGSGIMAMHGLKEANDIDLVVSPEIFESSKNEGWESVPYTYPDKLGKFYLQKADIELYLDVNHGELFRPSLEELLERAEVFSEIPFLSLNDLLKFKKSYNRPKDLNDVRLIEKFLTKQI